MKDSILSIINELDNLPADHEPTAEDLWGAIRQIEKIAPEEKLIAPYVEAIDSNQNQYRITTPLGEWFQSYETTIAFKGEFGVLIDKDWWEGDRTRTTSKYLARWLSQLDTGIPQGAAGCSMKDVHAKVKSGEYKLTYLTNYTQHPTPNTQ